MVNIFSKILINIEPHFKYWTNNNNDSYILKSQLKKTIFPMYLLKNSYNNNFYIANLFYKINTEMETFESNIEFIKDIENPYSLKFIDNFEDKDFYYAIYEYYDEILYDFILKYRKTHYTMPKNFIHKILTQLNVCL